MLKMTDDRILVRVIDDGGERKTGGGIIVPATAREEQRGVRGEVVAVGPGHRNDDGKIDPMPVEKGNVVVFSKYVGIDLKIERDPHFIIRATDVLAVEYKAGDRIPVTGCRCGSGEPCPIAEKHTGTQQGAPTEVGTVLDNGMTCVETSNEAEKY